MNEERQEPDSVPGSGAGDAATSQASPRLPRPAKNPARTSSAGGASTSKNAAPKKSTSKKADTKSLENADDAADDADESETDETPEPEAVGSETDKGRVRTTPAVDQKSEQVTTKTPRRVEPVETGRPLTAADYARTTKPSPSTTSVIPAVKDEPIAEATQAPTGGSTRQASLRLNHVEPWSVARIAFAISVAMMIVGVVAMTIFWVVLNVAGVWDQVNEAVTSVLSDDSSSFNITDYLGFWRLIGLTLVLSAINVVLMTALATIGAHLYNLAAQVLGGVEVTFSEED